MTLSKVYMRVVSFFREDFFSKRLIRYPLLLAAFVNIIMWIVILIKTGASSKPIPLHVNAFYGVELVDSGLFFLNIPLVGLLLLLLNTFLARYIFRYDSFLAVILNLTSAVLQILLMVATLNIIFFNT